MREQRTRTAALYLSWVWLAGCQACDSKTPVPFKRVGPDAGAAQDAGLDAAAAHAETVTSFPEGTQKVELGGTTITRTSGQIYAALERDLDADGKPDVLLVASDDSGLAALEAAHQESPDSAVRVPLRPEPLGRGCRALGAQLALLGAELGLASVDYQCDAAAVSGAVTPAADSGNAPPADLPPPEPDAVVTQTQHFVFSLSMKPTPLLRLCADWSPDASSVDPELLISGADIDGDQLEDVAVELQPRTADQPEPDAKPDATRSALKLTWLNRTTGLARERQEPEASLQTLANDANKKLAKNPKDAIATAAQALALHRLLCKESGGARLWVDNERGIACGASSAAGKALATTAIAQARLQQLLPALEARAGLDEPGYAVDRKLREQVTGAIGTIHGDTRYSWRMGPTLRGVSAPSLRLPAIGFIDDDTLLLRGGVPQSYDLRTRELTPTGMPGGVLASDSANHYVLTDIVRGCDGYRVRIVPAGRVIGGIVTGVPSSEPLLLPPSDGSDPATCNRNLRTHSDHGGFVLLGTNAVGAVFARGKHLWLLPLTANGDAAGAAREVPPDLAVSPLLTPGALDPSARYVALATSEGVVLIDRAQDSARLIRKPESCAGGTVSDAVLAPSGKKLAMVCAGRVYVAEPAAESGEAVRPISEHP